MIERKVRWCRRMREFDKGRSALDGCDSWERKWEKGPRIHMCAQKRGWGGINEIIQTCIFYRKYSVYRHL